jgi:peptide/nickel transport system ATP-binding protein
MALLEVDNLTIGYDGRDGLAAAVDSVSFDLKRGQTLGIVGESGCGKTTIGMAILRLLPENASVLSGKILFEGQDLLALSAEAMREVRWKKIAMIFQAAMNALNPVQRVDKQIAEALLTHEPGLDKQTAFKRVAELFDVVGIPNGRLRDYPHQYSGGMKQRAIIAMALICQPLLLIADEPTTALDVIVQDQIIKEIKGLQEKMNIAMIFISHDISVVADVCDNIAVIYDGWMVEIGSRKEVLATPAHPYTRMLLASNLTLGSTPDEPISLQESVMHGDRPADRCPFYPRCQEYAGSCRGDSHQWVHLSSSHRVFCNNTMDAQEV